jgi:epsilon-lactone hydrolase
MRGALAFCGFAILSSVFATATGADAQRVEEDGTVHVPGFDLPESAFLSEETRNALKRYRARQKELAALREACPPLESADRKEMPAIRQCQANAFYQTSLYKDLRARYGVSVTARQIGGVPTEVFTPIAGIPERNAHRVLINLHGGGFQGGSRTSSQLESIPIAALAKIKVIAIDYRMAPEYTFPAASEDVGAAYRQLLKTYRPQNIGLYGCSSGAVLTAQSMAWFREQGLPLPGAIGLFCHGAPRFLEAEGKLGKQGERNRWVSSDGAYFVGAIFGVNFIERERNFPYYRDADVDTPLASPGDYDDLMAKFPPTLLISGTRDFTLSAVLTTHSQLVRLGVPAQLHVWEGMSHAFIHWADLPESREAYDVIVRFFDGHLEN